MAKKGISEQEYLNSELLSEVKHELFEGFVYAMAGASADHGRISGNLFARLPGPSSKSEVVM